MAGVISNTEHGKVLERQQFDRERDQTAKDDSVPGAKSRNAVWDEIHSVIRQATAPVLFLTLLEVSRSADLLIYTKICLFLKCGESQDCASLTDPEGIFLFYCDQPQHKQHEPAKLLSMAEKEMRKITSL